MSNDHDNHRSHAPRLARLALHVPDAGSSGIIDIADLRVDPLCASLASSLAVSARPSATARRKGPTIALRSALAAGVAVLGLAGAFRLAPSMATDDTSATGGQLAMHEAAFDSPAHVLSPAPIEARSRAPARITSKAESSEDAQLADPESAAAELTDLEPAADPEPAPSATRKTRSRSTKASTSTPKSTAPARPPRTASPASSISVECVLDPARCDPRASASASSTSASSRPAPLPAKLSITQLKTALAVTKADARRCGPEHGADAGTTVRVQLSIEGATGSVVSATAQGDHAKTPLGVCVARALGQTQFSRFTAKRMGTLYSVRL